MSKLAYSQFSPDRKKAFNELVSKNINLDWVKEAKKSKDNTLTQWQKY